MCLVDSLIPGEPATVSFMPGEGHCKRATMTYMNPTNTFEVVYRDVLNEAGLTLLNNASYGLLLALQTPSDLQVIRNGAQTTWLPGQEQFTRKHLMWKNLKRYYGEDAALLTPLTFILPLEQKVLRQHQANHPGSYYIFKPLDNSRGRGIYLFPANETPNTEGIAQVYEELVTLNGYKFDLRVYLLITNTDPLVAYVYKEGLARLASSPYEPPTEQNRHILQKHLTNAALNQQEFVPIKLDDDLSTKLLMSEVFERLSKNRDLLFDSDVASQITPEFLLDTLRHTLKNVLVGTLPSVLANAARVPRHSSYPRQFHGLFGADVGIRKNGSFVIFEINNGPNLQTSGQIDVDVKTPMMRETLHIAGIRMQTSRFDPKAIDPTMYNNIMDPAQPSQRMLDIESKRVLLQIADELARAKEYLPLNCYKAASVLGKWNALVADEYQRIVDFLSP